MMPDTRIYRAGRKEAYTPIIVNALICSAVVLLLFYATCFLDLAYSFIIKGVPFYDIWQAFYEKPIPLSDLAVAFLFLWLICVVLTIWRSWLRRQKVHAFDNEQYSKDHLTRMIQKRYQKRFWVSFALFSAIIMVLIVAFFLVKDSRIWYANDPFFSVLNTMKNLFPYAIICVWVGGAAILLFNQWRQSASDIIGLLDSIAQMQAGKEGDVIEVPENLVELKPVLQGMFDKSCEDRKVAHVAEQRKNDLIIYLAHDLKTPLTSVVGYLSLLNDSDSLSDEQRADYARIAREKALRLEDLIDEFFEISRFSLYEVELDKSAFSLNLLLMQLADEFFPLLDEQGKSIAIDAVEGIEIYGDAGRLARVFNNILRNALAYSSPESIIEIRAAISGGSVVVSVANQGETIPQHQLDQVFEKFFRLDEARATDSGGAGLGLAIAREIVVRHNGTITATSENGRTVFTVTLPYIPPSHAG